MRSDSDAARERLRGLSPEEIAEGVRELHPALREEPLSLLEYPEEVVPLLPDTELATTICAVGLADAGWLLEFATPEQRVACVDLDCWQDSRFSLWRFCEWVDALLDAGDHTLAAAFDELDLELWVLALRQMGDFAVLGRSAEPPRAARTEDGVVFYTAHSEAHEHRLGEILRTALREVPDRYWQLVYGAMYATPAECEQYAARWHRGRLNDLGFPDRERALRVYRRLEPEAAAVVEAGRSAQPPGLVASSKLPQHLAGTLVGRALAELPGERAGDVLGAILAVGNAIAVADRLPLAEPESIEEALRKSARGIDRGLEALAKRRRESPSRILDQTEPLDLFRIGATLDPDLRPNLSLGDLEAEEEQADWAVESEVMEPEIIGPRDD